MVDVEEEDILRTIFKNDFPETWKENPVVAQSLRELSGYGLPRLNKEPEILAEERSAILDQTQELVFNNYKTFIETADCSRELFQHFNQVEGHLKAVSDRLPRFIEKCQEFSEKSQEINASRKLNSLTLSRHTQLLEILEMPQLMDTCVRNSYYDEALELSAYVSHLAKKHAATVPIVSAIALDVNDSLRLMLSQLLHQLQQTNIQLPQCLKVISYLRRMDVFSEEELRIRFLQARDSWFQNVLNAIPADDPYQHVTKVIEVSRVHLFDIMTQYRAIFSDDDPLSTCPREVQRSRAAIAQSWALQKVSQFLATLERDLECEALGGRLDSLLGQCMYFGLSFGRVGCDFRGLLVPLFERAVLRCFRKSVDEATATFHELMKSFVLLAQSSVGTVSSILATSTVTQDKLHPPLCLLDFPPLAALCNGILSAFNNLRLLPPLSLVCDIDRVLEACLVAAADTVLDYNRTEEASLSLRERETFARFCAAFAHDLVPFVDRCLWALFPGQQVAQILGMSVLELDKLKTFGHLDVAAILEPLSGLLPEAETFLRENGRDLPETEEEAAGAAAVTPQVSEPPEVLPKAESGSTVPPEGPGKPEGQHPGAESSEVRDPEIRFPEGNP